MYTFAHKDDIRQSGRYMLKVREVRPACSGTTYGNLVNKFEQNWRVAEMMRDMPVI